MDKEKMPLNTTVLDIERSQLASLLERKDMRGIELGVASGDYSNAMIRTGLFARVWGIDLYGDHHDTQEYKSALKQIGITENYTLLRMSFDDALDLFPDDFFDFIYIDGYAHTGEQAGKTIFDWYKKVKIGGMIAGHDYDKDWPLVVKAVDRFIADAGLKLLITKKTQNPGPQDLHSSWATIRETDFSPEYPDDLQKSIKDQVKPRGSKKKRPLKKLINFLRMK